MWIVIFCVAAVLLLAVLKPKKAPRKHAKPSGSKVSVSVSNATRFDGPPPADYVRQQEVDQAAALVNMQRVLSASPEYIPERVPELMSRIRDGMNFFPFGGELLSVEQKREAGMNTRLSVPSDVLLFYTPAGLKTWTRRGLFEVYSNCANMIHRQRSLENLERAGCKRLKVAGCETYKGQLFPLSSPPTVPCSDCSKRICTCDFSFGD